MSNRTPNPNDERRPDDNRTPEAIKQKRWLYGILLFDLLFLIGTYILFKIQQISAWIILIPIAQIVQVVISVINTQRLENKRSKRAE